MPQWVKVCDVAILEFVFGNYYLFSFYFIICNKTLWSVAPGVEELNMSMVWFGVVSMYFVVYAVSVLRKYMFTHYN